MPTDPTANLFEDRLEHELAALVRIIVSETDALMNVLPLALGRQWEPSPVPRTDGPTRKGAGTVPDPTSATALDQRRLEVSQTVKRSAHTLRDTAVRLRAARLALETAVARYDGTTS